MLLKTKLIIGVSSILLLLGINSVVDWISMNTIRRLTEESASIEAVKEAAQDYSISALRSILYNDALYRVEMREHLAFGIITMRNVLSHMKEDERRRQAHEVIVSFGDVQALFQELEDCMTRQTTHSGTTNECDELGLQEQARTSIINLIALLKNMTALSLQECNEVGEMARIVSLVVSVLVLLLGAGITVTLLRIISRPLDSALHFAKIVANGDFNARWQYAERDEIGQMAVALNTAFAKVSELAFWYEGILDSIPNAITVSNNNMRWTFLNKTALQFLGKPRESLLGEPCSSWSSPVCNTENCGVVRLRNDPTLRTAHTVFHHNEQVLAAECSYLINSLGERVGHVTFIRDITEDERLRIEAEAASRAKSVFLSTISHELRTPMNAIVGFTHLFERNNLTAAQNDKLDKIHVAAAALLGVINDVLSMAVIGAGNLELNHKPFCLSKMLQNIMAIVEKMPRNKGVDLFLAKASSFPDWLRGDEKHLRQVLLNLMSNAVKFTSHGEVRLNVDIAQETSPEDQMILAFTITDTGIGIAQEHLGRLFAPFSQVDASINRRFGGTGLGLCISRQLVERMGGSIGVTSEPGVGSVFRVLVPFDAVPIDSIPEAEFLPIPGEDVCMAPLADAWAKAKKLVLVVEDNEINQEIAVALLESYGLSVDVASHGQMALDMALSTHYDLIFMDMQMPIMDGLEATRRLRVLGKQAEQAITDEANWLYYVPIIAMTANALPEDRQRCLDAGMDDHISKPIEPVVLQRCLQKWIEMTCINNESR